MSPLASIERRQLTAESICEHVSTSPLLAQLLRQLTIDRILWEWQPALTVKSVSVDPESELDSTDTQVPILDHQAKLQQFKQVIELNRPVQKIQTI